MGDVNEILLDKLGERVVFERTGTRLYEALISKYLESEDKKALPDQNRLEQFHQEELKHFEVVSAAIKRIGGEPPIITPATDLNGTLGMGWMLAITDARTSFVQALEIVLQAELVDYASWELLIELTERQELADVATQFQECLNEKEVHLIMLKQWLQDLILDNQVQGSDQHQNIILEGNSNLRH
jgi:hypothetical protein